MIDLMTGVESYLEFIFFDSSEDARESILFELDLFPPILVAIFSLILVISAFYLARSMR